MAITVSVPLGAARETRQALFNFSVPDGCLVADSCFDCPLPDCQPKGLLCAGAGDTAAATETASAGRCNYSAPYGGQRVDETGGGAGVGRIATPHVQGNSAEQTRPKVEVDNPTATV